MFGKKNKTPSNLDEIIVNLEKQILTEDEGSDDYPKLVDHLEKLYQLRDGTKSKHSTQLKDWLPIIGSIGGVLIIVTFEAFGHTLTSKSVEVTSKLRNLTQSH